MVEFRFTGELEKMGDRALVLQGDAYSFGLLENAVKREILRTAEDMTKHDGQILCVYAKIEAIQKLDKLLDQIVKSNNEANVVT